MRTSGIIRILLLLIDILWGNVNFLRISSLLFVFFFLFDLPIRVRQRLPSDPAPAHILSRPRQSCSYFFGSTTYSTPRYTRKTDTTIFFILLRRVDVPTEPSNRLILFVQKKKTRKNGKMLVRARAILFFFFFNYSPSSSYRVSW